MRRELSTNEKRSIEREFIAKEELRAKRRRFCRSVFVVGITAGTLSALLRGCEVHSAATPLSHLVWIACLVIYVGGLIRPLSFSKDIDPRWHLNPWKDSLINLSAGRNLGEAIALLAGPHLLKIAASLIYMSFQ
jgi:hypothetical protein